MMKEVPIRKYDLAERLIKYAVLIIKINDSLHDSKAGNHIGGQLLRSGTHPALHYGEAQSAESRQDFIHKFKVLLKELRETKNALLIIKLSPLTREVELINEALKETEELISISVTSIATAERNLELEMKEKKEKKNKQRGQQSTDGK